MSVMRVVKLEPLLTSPGYNNNLFKVATVRITLENMISGEQKTFTDLDQQKSRRSKPIQGFVERYQDASKDHRVSIIQFVIPYSEEATLSDYIRFLKRRLKQVSGKLLGYFWVLDTGTQRNGLHYHLTIATEPIPEEKKSAADFFSNTEKWANVKNSEVEKFKNWIRYKWIKEIPNVPHKKFVLIPGSLDLEDGLDDSPGIVKVITLKKVRTFGKSIKYPPPEA